jgi:hypothetical protein
MDSVACVHDKTINWCKHKIIQQLVSRSPFQSSSSGESGEAKIWCTTAQYANPHQHSVPFPSPARRNWSLLMISSPRLAFAGSASGVWWSCLSFLSLCREAQILPQCQPRAQEKLPRILLARTQRRRSCILERPYHLLCLAKHRHSWAALASLHS